MLGLAEVKSTWSVNAGPHMCHKDKDTGKQLWEQELYPKNYLNSDCALQLVHIKLESLVIVNEIVAVNQKSNFAHTAHHARIGVFTLYRVIVTVLLLSKAIAGCDTCGGADLS